MNQMGSGIYISIVHTVPYVYYGTIKCLSVPMFLILLYIGVLSHLNISGAAYHIWHPTINLLRINVMLGIVRANDLF